MGVYGNSAESFEVARKFQQALDDWRAFLHSRSNAKYAASPDDLAYARMRVRELRSARHSAIRSIRFALMDEEPRS